MTPSLREALRRWRRTYWLTDMDISARVQKESSWETWQASAASMAEQAAKVARCLFSVARAAQHRLPRQRGNGD